MPGRVKDIESTLGVLVQSINKLTEALGCLVDSQDPKRIIEGQKRLGEYTVWQNAKDIGFFERVSVEVVVVEGLAGGIGQVIAGSALEDSFFVLKA